MDKLMIPLKLLISTANTTIHRYNLTKNFSIYKLNLEFKKYVRFIFGYKKMYMFVNFHQALGRTIKGGPHAIF
jgi:hypothetical protein